MNAANQRRLTPFLVAPAVLLAVLLLLLIVGAGRKVRWGAPRALAPLPPAGNAGDLPKPLPLQHFAEVWQAPLFNPSRKPRAQAAAEGSNLGDLELTGVILTPGLHMALLHDKQRHKQVRLKQGESLPDGSVTLIEVHARSALFDSSAGRTELTLAAGAPIDPLKGTNDADQSRTDAGPPPPDGRAAAGNGMRRVQPTGNQLQPGASGRSIQPAAPGTANSPAQILNRLRQLKQQQQQQRRAQGDAANHSKE